MVNNVKILFREVTIMNSTNNTNKYLIFTNDYLIFCISLVLIFTTIIGVIQ